MGKKRARCARGDNLRPATRSAPTRGGAHGGASANASRTFLQSVAVGVLACLTTACPEPYTLGFPGPFPTEHYAAHYSAISPEVTVFVPREGPDVGLHPAVVFSTGWNQPRASYYGFATQLAEWGFVTVVRSDPSLGLRGIGGPELLEVNADEVSRIVDWLATENRRRGSPLYGQVDAQTVGALGHSMGGRVSLIAGSRDPRIRAVVTLDVKYGEPRLDCLVTLETSTAAILILGSDDVSWCSRPPDATCRLFDRLHAPAGDVSILGADHMDFEDCMIGLSYLLEVTPCCGGTMDAQQVRDIATRYAVAWFNVYLHGWSGYSDYYAGRCAREDMERGLVTIHLRQ